VPRSSQTHTHIGSWKVHIRKEVFSLFCYRGTPKGERGVRNMYSLFLLGYPDIYMCVLYSYPHVLLPTCLVSSNQAHKQTHTHTYTYTHEHQMHSSLRDTEKTQNSKVTKIGRAAVLTNTHTHRFRSHHSWRVRILSSVYQSEGNAEQKEAERDL
jgi:hypothetical protein